MSGISTGGGISYVPGATPPAGSNPTASVGVAAVNGSAQTFMRSDAAPAINQAITPTWSGLHTFSAGLNAGGFNWINLAGAVDGGVPAITTAGGNANVSLLISTKGSGGITLDRDTAFAPGGSTRLTVSSTDLAAGAGYTPGNALSLATKAYVDSATGGGPTLASGTYTPSVLFTSNATVTTVGLFFYQRVGNVVNVIGRFSATVSNNASSASIRFSVPVATSFTTSNQATGFGTTVLNPVAAGQFSVISFAGDNSASLTLWSANTSGNDYGINFSYTVQ